MPEPLMVEQHFSEEDKQILAEHRFEVLRLMKEGREIFLKKRSDRVESQTVHRNWLGSLWGSAKTTRTKD
jgi:hypothetical protein